MEIPSEWVERAEAFLRDAEAHVKDGLYWLSCFEVQQAVELYLKGFILARAETCPWSYLHMRMR
nr:HEPN domain-containing protein [Vulcanisaeta thermophila]